MNGASRIIDSKFVATPHCTAVSGSRECSLSITTVMPPVKTVQGRPRA